MNTSNHNTQDKALTCCDCGLQFIFTPGEQEFYRSKQLSTPKRCKACREKRRATLVPEPEVRYD